MALEGDLSEFHLTDIIQLIDLSKKSGAVFLQGQRSQQRFEGWMYFRDGKIIGARLEGLPALEAAYTFFTFVSGPFRFHDDVQLDVPTITQSNEMIIMEGIMRQEAWLKLQEHVPSLNMVPRLVPNPAATGSEINLEADEWRVLTMVNGKNTVAQIAQRSGLGEMRTCEIISELLVSGLIERRDVHLAEALFPDLERIATSGLGSSAAVLLHDAYGRVGITDQNTATKQQVLSALDVFEGAVIRMFGAQRARQPLDDLRSFTQQVFSSM